MITNKLLAIGDNKDIIRRNILIVCASYLVLEVLLAGFSVADTSFINIVLNALYILPVIIAFIACVWAAERSHAYKRLWTLMSVGTFFWLSGAVIQFYYTTTLGPKNIPSPSLVDAFSVAYVPIVLAILLSIARIRPPFDARKKQIIANTSMAGLSVFLLCYKFVLIPKWYADPSMDLLQKIFTIAYPVVDCIIFVSLIFASIRFLENRIEGWLILLLAAFTFNVLSDIPASVFGFQLNSISIVVMDLGAFLITLSAIDEITGTIIGIREKSRAKDRKAHTSGKTSWHSYAIPIVPALVISFIWFAWYNNGQRIEAPVLAAGSTLMMLLLIYRNHLLVQDNAILLAKNLHDTLTGLNNHRFFQEALSKAVAKAEKTSKPVSLIVLDIDNFSLINNKYGHVFGDRALMLIGNAIASSLRETDEACRLSGDDFGIILPKTDGIKARAIAESINASIKHALHDNSSNTIITICFGVSSYPTLANSKDELLRTADGALYWGKLSGKDNVVLYDSGIVEALNAEERASKVEKAALTDMVRSLAQAVDARDSYTRLHSRGVSAVAADLARYIGLDEKTVGRIEMAGTLHDIGKIGVPDHILNKPGRLTNDEIDIIMNHPELSAQIIQSTSLKEIIPAVKSHHERWDGQGYPDGLESNEIPIEARILAIADTFDAMTTSRPYRTALPVEDALAEIKRCAGTQFDPRLAQQFLLMFGYEPHEADLAGIWEEDNESSIAS